MSLPVGDPVEGWAPISEFRPGAIEGRQVTVSPLVAGAIDGLWDALSTDEAATWTYMGYGPFPDATALTALVEGWLLGQAGGGALADLLLGVANPSGKSPFTYPYAGKGFIDRASELQFPGVLVEGAQTVEYTERLNIGYRWYDANVSGDCAHAADGSNPCVAFPL